MYRATLLLALVLLGTALKSCKKMANPFIGVYAKSYPAYAQGGTPPPTNQAPSVTINGTATGTVGTQQSFQAIASDSDGQVVKVELCLMANASTLINYTVLDTDLVSPFVLNWTPSSAGNFNLRMRATDDKGATSFSSVLPVQVATASNLLISYVPIGTSITYGAQVGGPGSGNTYAELTAAAINQAVGTQRVTIAENMGIPSRSAHYFLTNTTLYNGITPLQHALTLVKPGYLNVATLEYDANGLVYGDSGTDPSQAFTPAQVLSHVEQIYTQLKAGGYDLVGVSFTMNRTGYPDFANYSNVRLPYNRLQLASTVFQDGRINLPAYPNLYGFNAPNSTTYFAAGATASGTDGSHLSAAGHVEMAKPNAQWFARHIPGITLPSGNGSEPTTAEDSTANQPSATITVTPMSGSSAQLRTATVAIQNDPGFTSAQLYRQATVGGARTAVGSPTTQKPFSFSFTPTQTGYYSFGLARPANAEFFTNSVQVMVGVQTQTQTWLNVHRQNATQQPDGTLLATGGSATNFDKLATGDYYLPTGQTDDYFEFTMPDRVPNDSDAAVNIGLSTAIVTADGTVQGIAPINRANFYWEGPVSRLFKVIQNANGGYEPRQVGADFARPDAGKRIRVTRKADGFYITADGVPLPNDPNNTVGQAGYIADSPGNLNLYVNAVLSKLQVSRVPVLTLTGAAIGVTPS
jgi:lysophospholipase L1-like esterase